MRLNLFRRGLLLSWLALVALVTLSPVSPSGTIEETLPRWCILCGDRGLADAILNLLFFAPLGVALAGGRQGVRRAFLAGTFLSLAIELAQLLIPGRYSTLGDLVWNGLGAAAGVVGARATTYLLRPPRWAGPLAAIGLGAVVGVSGWLLAVAPTRSAYYGQWTADLGHMPQYRGELLTALLDGRPVPNTKFAVSDSAQLRLAGDWAIEARVMKGPPPLAVSPILSVYDSLEVEILVLGAHRDHLVLRERTRAKAVRLDQPDLRLPNAFDGADVGDTVTIRAGSIGDDRCLSANGVGTCGLGYTPGRTWALLLYVEGQPESFRRAVDALWAFFLMLCVGAASTSLRGAVAHGGIAAGWVALAVALTRLVVPPLPQIAAGVTGLFVGRLLFAYLARILSPQAVGVA